MKKLRYFVIAIGLIAMTLSCSQKKEEAAKLEQEVLDQESSQVAVTDSAVEMIDSAALTELDARAVPEEEMEPELPSMPGQPMGSGFTVQVAGCEDEDYARHLVDVYTKRGYEPYVNEVSIDGQVYYRVRIGVFESFGVASALKSELSDKYSIEPWVDQITQ